MPRLNKLIEQIETNLQIKYPSHRIVEEIIYYIKQKTKDIHPAVNFTFEKNGEDFLKIYIEGLGTVVPFFKTLDTLLIHIHEKEEMQTKEKYRLK